MSNDDELDSITWRELRDRDDFSLYLMDLRGRYEQLSYDTQLLHHWLNGAPHPDDQSCALDMWEDSD